MPELIRLCPSCKSERPTSEIYCEGMLSGAKCNWALFDIPVTSPEGDSSQDETDSESVGKESQAKKSCANGHQMEDGDILCMICGAGIALSTAIVEPVAPEDAPFEWIGREIENWTITSQVATLNGSKECFSVTSNADEQKAFLTLYLEKYEPDQAIYSVLRATEHDHVPDLIAFGRWENRAYEVCEWIDGGTLSEAGYITGRDIDVVKRITDELGRALRDFSDKGLRHRDICPRTILIRENEPLDLVIADFGSARLSDFDLDTVAPLELTRYSAPEAIVGGVSAASDWWGLGMILLEQVTDGECFRDINDKAYMIHIVTRGIEIPQDIEIEIRNLLSGLLARDPIERWQWDEVEKWLEGEFVAPPRSQENNEETIGEKEIFLNGNVYRSPERFALAAAEEKNWEAAKEMFLSGALATWVREIFEDGTVVSTVQRLHSSSAIDTDWQFSLALMKLNKFLPLTRAGQIISPAWLLENPRDGYELIMSEVPLFLEQMDREKWLVSLHFRRGDVLDRAKVLDVALEQSRLEVNLLATSRANLDAEKDLLREIYPTTNHGSLSSLLEKSRLSEDELIVLLSAEHSQFVPLQQVIDETKALFSRIEIGGFDSKLAASILRLPRRQIYEKIDDHIVGFARYGHENIDNWADTFRVERRIPLPRAVLILSTSKEQWVEPDKHDYCTNVLRFFEKRVANSVLRGPLVRLTISKTTAKIDLMELGAPSREASAILESLIKRDDIPRKIDPIVYQSDPQRDRRIFRMLTQANAFRRDTGVDSLYLGFPFLIIGGANSARPKIAPILLWPIAMDYKMGAQGSLTISFDRDREEVRLNPALEGLVGREELEHWIKARRDILEKSFLSTSEVMNTFGSIVEARRTTITKHPAVSHTIDEGGREVECSAVIFNAQFSGQAISEDIRRMQTIPLNNTSLEPMLKISDPVVESLSNQSLSELERFSIVPADPSQDKAVISGRRSPGLVVEGPPGTGKSQTIVNIIADCIGRGESVLVVCQKQAALRVVEKRLESEGLIHRLINVTDINRDRQNIIRAIRDQLNDDMLSQASVIEQINQNRISAAGRIDRLETELNSRHAVVHAVDKICGMTYRTIVGELIDLESSNEFEFIDVPQLRALFSNTDPDRVNVIEESCSSWSSDWLNSKYENSCLSNFKIFPVDEAILELVKEQFLEFSIVERDRCATNQKESADFDHGDIEKYATWAAGSKKLFLDLSNNNVSQIAAWFEKFYDEINEKSIGMDILEDLARQYANLQKLDVSDHDTQFFDSLITAESDLLSHLIIYSDTVLAPRTIFSMMNPLRLYRKKRIYRFMRGIGENYSIARVESLRSAVKLEKNMRSIRFKVAPLLKKLGVDYASETKPSLKWMNKEIAVLLADLRVVETCTSAVKNSPLKKEAIEMIQSGDIAAYHSFFERVESAEKRNLSRSKSRSALDALGDWISTDWITNYQRGIDSNSTSLFKVDAILAELDRLKFYQAFRIRSESAQEDVFEVFSRLRSIDSKLQNVNEARLGGTIRCVIRREALLGWKLRIQHENPSILMAKAECENKVAQLKQAYELMHQLNRKLLMTGINKEKVGSQTQWNEITKLRGPKYKKLREFFDQGMELGLMDIRPVWLMSPEVVSQALPLKSCLFDVVIFDEASQIMVDYSIPSLYRSKRVIISGDEKQMPPTSFFSSHVESDEDDVEEELDEYSGEAERAHYEESWNRKEIKDCPDLLALGKGILPTETLQIHYRSEYRALIEYSNAAFYGGKLNIPALHPDDEVLRVKPIELVSVMGTYTDQSNRDEALEIVKLLSKYWGDSSECVPSIGVVTFNRKQAELIGDVLQEHAESDPAFYGAYTLEKERVQNGEDMGFFIKPVENVQGDERDVIIFSTTFGRNEHGDFRKSFGVLGHRGGERRLNVAITRARSKVIIVTSMPIREISDMMRTGRPASKPRDYLQGYLEYGRKVSDGQVAIARKAIDQARDSEGIGADQDRFLNSVANYVSQIGYKPERSENISDAFKIDIALEHPETKLYGIGIECDSPINELLTKAKYREIWRPDVLRKSVPKLHRVSCYDWYHDRDNEQSKLKSAITKAVG